MAKALHRERKINHFSHAVPISDLKPGDHIYAYRKKALFLYSHHGIYLGVNEQGEDIIVHFINTGNQMLKTSDFSAQDVTTNPVFMQRLLVEERDDEQTVSGDSESLTKGDADSTDELSGKIEIRTLNRFLKGSSARLVSYGASSLGVFGAGSVHTLPSKPASEVITTAEYYLNNPKEWGKYDFFTNNCETFCIYCKTGEKDTKQYNDQNKGKLAKVLNPFVRTFRGSLASI